MSYGIYEKKWVQSFSVFLKRNNFADIAVLLFICLTLAILVSCTPRSPSDPIDRLVAELSPNPFFGNGLHPVIKLPKTALPEQVAAIALGQSVTNLVVLEIKQVTILYGSTPKEALEAENTKYTAVLVDTKPINKVVFMQYRIHKDTPGWWWTEVFDLK